MSFVRLNQTRLFPGLLRDRQTALLAQGLEHQWQMCDDTGRLENFRRVARSERNTFVGRAYNDSDVHKIAEATAYALVLDPESPLRARFDEYVRLVEGAQEADGYLNTKFTLDHPEKRYMGLSAWHELYNMGHFLEAVCASAENGLSDRLTAVGWKVADHVYDTFGPGRRKGYCGHQEMELALARFARVTNDDKYLELSRWMTDMRGTRPSPFEQEMLDPERLAFSRGYESLVMVEGKYEGVYCQDDRPLRDQTEAVGHSVRAMYQFCGALDGYGNTDPQLNHALQTIWNNLVTKRTYLTGGVGSSGQNEGFTFDYDLPNRSAYAETCAGIGLCFWAARMSRTFGDSTYDDMFERSLFNGVLSGMNTDGDEYFYENPLESRGDRQRKPWYDCACCPPNIARFLLSIGQYCVSSSDDTVTVHLPLTGEYTVQLGKGHVTVHIEGDYPWDENITVRTTSDVPFKLRLRIPGWCDGATVTTGGKRKAYAAGWAVLEAKAGTDQATLDLPMPVQRIKSDPRVLENLGRVAFQRGPVVYCLEGVDLGAPAQTFAAKPGKVTLDGPIGPATVTVSVPGVLDAPHWDAPLYAPQTHVHPTPTTARFVPYFVWANRGQSTMEVWVREAL